MKQSVSIISANTVVVGSGAAGLNAAKRLWDFGQKDVVVVTEGLHRGTSRNTGSDKQTYYKLTLAGDGDDSIREMAETLFGGGCMHGDISLVEAALSAQSFFHLVEIGVPFPHNRYGEYIGYKTDHDPRQRATSAGPLTSHYMTERLTEQVLQRGIKIVENQVVVALFTDHDRSKVVGLLTLDTDSTEEYPRYLAFNCNNIVYAVGGPAAIYQTSVYPESQTGATGVALEAGAMGQNLTESQYGLASIKYRWNLSGTYQQVLPCYVSTDQNGDDRQEFLAPWFPDRGKMFDAVFLKGYQWPFDPRKVADCGSSLIDLLVYQETVLRNRRVFLDYRQNPAGLNFSLLGSEAYSYLERSGALFGRPIDRLLKMNEPAVELYKRQGIDLEAEMLEIAVCAQHNNGGLSGNIWWESNLRHFFPVGEVNGSHGVYRPGGSALNSGQVGSFRAAQYIAKRYNDPPRSEEEFQCIVGEQLREKLGWGEQLAAAKGKKTVGELRREMQNLMSSVGGHVRSLAEVDQALQRCQGELGNLPHNIHLKQTGELAEAFKLRDMLLTQYAYLAAIKDYIERGGRSRGSYLIRDDDGFLPAPGLPELFRFSLDEGHSGLLQRVQLVNGQCCFTWQPVRPIPDDDYWFENVWNEFRNDEIVC